MIPTAISKYFFRRIWWINITISTKNRYLTGLNTITKIRKKMDACGWFCLYFFGQSDGFVFSSPCLRLLLFWLNFQLKGSKQYDLDASLQRFLILFKCCNLPILYVSMHCQDDVLYQILIYKTILVVTSGEIFCYTTPKKHFFLLLRPIIRSVFQAR